MNSRHLLGLCTLLLLSACSGVSDTRPEPIRKSEYFLEHGVSAFENSDYVAASDFLRKALAHYRSIDDTTGALLSRINLAETALAAGNFTAAAEQVTAAESLSLLPEHQEYRPRLTLLQAQIQWRQQQRDEALQLLARLLPEFDEEQRSRGKGNLLLLGATTLRTDIAFSTLDSSPDEARLWLQRLSLMLSSSEERTPLHHARLLRFEAELAYHDNATQQALQKLEEALQLYREAAARPAIAATLTESARLLMAMEQWQEAEAQLQRALYIRLWIMDRSGTSELLELLQSVYQELGEEERYRKTREQAEEIISRR
jgi:tetratricopeptide (TPR) repeat protein